MELTAIYENYQDQEIEFLIGAKYAICAAQFLRSLPELLLSFLNVLIGILLLAAAVYFSGRHVGEQSLLLIHGCLILSALTLVINGFLNYLRTVRAGRRSQGNYIWILGIGVLIGLTIYYFSGASERLPVTLFAMFLYVLSEGVHLFTGYVRQQLCWRRKRHS